MVEPTLALMHFDDGPKAVKYYNLATRNILRSRPHNYRFLDPEEPSPPEEIAIQCWTIKINKLFL
jgi:hypothetical protein